MKKLLLFLSLSLAASAQTTVVIDPSNPPSYPVGSNNIPISVDSAGRMVANGGGGGGSGTVTVVSAGNLTSTAIVTGGGAQTVQTPSATTTLDSSGNISTQGSVSTGVGGSVAGYVAFGQGSATTAPTSSVGFMGPASVTTKYMIALPGAPTTGFVLRTGTSDPQTESIVAFNGTGNVLRSAGTAAIASGKTLTVSNSITIAGTDSTTMTMPTTNATIARTDAAQTFTGTQTGTFALSTSSTAVTQTVRNNTTTVASTAYADRAALVGNAPSALTESAGATTIDWSLSNTFTLTLNANLATVTFSNSTSGQTIIVRLTNTASNYTVTWGNSIKWAGGSQPVQTVGAKDDVWTIINLGGTYYGSVVQNF